MQVRQAWLPLLLPLARSWQQKGGQAGIFGSQSSLPSVLVSTYTRSPSPEEGGARVTVLLSRVSRVEKAPGREGELLGRTPDQGSAACSLVRPEDHRPRRKEGRTPYGAGKEKAQVCSATDGSTACGGGPRSGSGTQGSRCWVLLQLLPGLCWGVAGDHHTPVLPAEAAPERGSEPSIRLEAGP